MSPLQSPRLLTRHRRQSLALAATISTALLQSASAQNAADQRAPLTLRALLDSVRLTHPLVFAADSRVRATDASRITSRTFGNPTLAYQVDQVPFPGARPLALEREAMTTATIPLEFLYQRGPRIARANADLRAARAEAALTKQRVALDASAAFYRTALAQVTSATTYDLLAWLDTLVVYNRSRVFEGVAAEADLIRSTVERDRVAAEASMQDAELAEARAALTAFIDCPQTAALPTVAIDSVPLAVRSASSVSTDSRPDVRAAREHVASANAAVASERSMLVRQLGATIGTMQSGHVTSMIAGVSVPLPLFDQNRGERQRAGAERDAAVFEATARERLATAELRGASEAARVLTARAQQLARRDSTSFLRQAEESRRIALGAYREGAVPLLQVIDAARAWSDARLTFYRTIFAQHQSILKLVAAQGLDLFSTVPAPASDGGPSR